MCKGTSNHILQYLHNFSAHSLYLLELPDPLEHASIFIVTEMVISAATVPRVERVVSDTIESLIREVGLVLYWVRWLGLVRYWVRWLGPVPYQDLIQVLVMAVRHEDVLQPTVGLVHAAL